MILKGQKVILRPLRLSDAKTFVKWFNDPEVNKFLSVRKMDLAQEKKWIAARIKDKSRSSLTLCIETLDGRLIGNTSLEDINLENRRAMFGIVIGDKESWNQGFGSESARLIIDYGFKKLKLHRIALDVYEFNPRAIKVYKRLGFKTEGVKRDHTRWRGKYFNATNMGILDREWKSKN